MQKEIKDFDNYYITTDGKVISYKYKKPRHMKTWYQKSGYENVTLCKEGRPSHKSVHRLVAEAFISNPNNFLEINHKDGNPKNNTVENLEWCTRKQNIELSNLGFTRNFYICYIVNIKTNETVREFDSIVSASIWASENLGCSKSYIQKIGNISNGYVIIKKNV
jgi:hypothetical protein